MEACRYSPLTENEAIRLAYSDTLFHLAQLYEYSYLGTDSEKKELSISHLYRDCCTIRETILGHVNPLTLNVKFNLVRRDGNKLAMEQILAVLRRRKRKEQQQQQQKHESTIVTPKITMVESVLIECLQEMASFYDTSYLLSSHMQAEGLLVECLKEQQAFFGMDHPDTLLTTYRLAQIYHRRVHATAAVSTAARTASQHITTSQGTHYVNVINGVKTNHAAVISRILHDDKSKTTSTNLTTTTTTTAASQTKGERVKVVTTINDIIDILEPCYERQKTVFGIDHPACQRSMVLLLSLYMKGSGGGGSGTKNDVNSQKKHSSYSDKAYQIYQQMSQLQQEGRFTAL